MVRASCYRGIMRRSRSAALFLFLLLVVSGAGPASAAKQHRRLALPNTGPVVLVYHGIGPRRRFWVTPQQLSGDIKYLRDRQYHFVTLAQFAAYEENGLPLPQRSVLLTFDDGVQSVYQYALPITRKFEVPAVAFIIGRRLGLPGYMTPGQVKDLWQSGLWAIEAHTYDMHSYRPGQLGFAADLVNPLPGQTAAQLALEIQQDVEAEANTFKAIGLPQPTAFAFPFGIYGPEAVAVMHQTYPLLFDSTPELAAPHMVVIGRVDATTDPLGVLLSRYVPTR